MPLVFVGGVIQIPSAYYRPIVGIILLLGAARFLWPADLAKAEKPQDPPVWAGVLLGALIGLLSGLITGTGGGIFLSPIVLLFGWSDMRTASMVAAVFILCNSIAGLAGNVSVVKALPSDLPLYAGAVLAGAIMGTVVGIRFSVLRIQRAVGFVLIIAGCKLIGVY